MMPAGARKDRQSITSQWDATAVEIAGVMLKRTRHIVTANGTVTETFRNDWAETGYEACHVQHITTSDGRISAWHCHQKQTDGIFVVSGRLLVALYDARATSPTRGNTMALRLDACDPVLVIVPPMIWHGVKQLGGSASFVNIISRAYDYEDPDEWRLPADSIEIPFDIVHAS